MALLVLAQAVLPGRFMVATVDHGLRPAAAGEATAVAATCDRLGAAHRTLSLSLAPGPGVQARARAARYAALAAWAEEAGLSALVTAHHADDQAETLLMRLNRGAGVRGLAGMRATATVPGASDLRLLRPLLRWRRANLAQVVREAGLEAADDPSNCDPRFERARMRTAMAEASWLDPAGIAASAANIADADEAIGWMADKEWNRIEARDGTLEWQPDAPRAVRLRVLERIAAALGQGNARGTELSRWLESLEAGRVATLAGVRGDGQGAAWRFTAAPPHRAQG